MIPCKCGCGELILGYVETRPNRPTYYKKGHYFRHMGFSQSHIESIRDVAKNRDIKGSKNPNYGKKHPGMCTGENNPMFGRSWESSPKWKGTNVGYHGLHIRVRKLKNKSSVCEYCKIRAPKDFANISDKYLHDLSDWKYVCRICHKRIDRARREGIKG